VEEHRINRLIVLKQAIHDTSVRKFPPSKYAALKTYLLVGCTGKYIFCILKVENNPSKILFQFFKAKDFTWQKYPFGYLC